MINEVDTLLNDLLRNWHKWSARYQHGKGYPSQDATCRGARASRQFDDSDNLDAALLDSTMEALDAALDRIEQPWLTALMFQARNLATGVSVWRSPRLPDCAMERGVILLEARSKLMRELMKNGVMS